MAVTLRWGSSTDTGRLREINEDSLLVTDRLWAVADGMGGHAAGEVASRIAVESLRASGPDNVEAIVEAIRQANVEVLRRSREDPSTAGMGTTLSVLALVEAESGEQLAIANVGDSRVYRLHQGELEQLSEDHSLVQDLVREGRISPAEARVHPNRNVVTRTVGNDPRVDPDSWVIDPAAGDRFLLCSDGLTDEVEDHEIAQVLRTVKDSDEAATKLVDLANTAGGRDNITCVIVDVVDDGGKSRSASDSLARDPQTAAARPVVHDSGGRATASAHSDETIVPREPEPKRVTWRVIVFVAAVALVLVAAIGGTAWFARNTYHVGVDDDDCVTIYRGRPGGLLIWKPTVEECTGVDIGDVQPARQEEVRGGHETSTRDEAERYVENITTTTTTTPPTTTTTAPAAPGPTTTATTPPP